MWVCCEQPCAPRLKFRTPNRYVVLVDVRGRQDQLRDIIEGDQTQSRVGVERRGERPRRVLADVQNREAVLLRLAGRVLYLTFGRHRTGDVQDDHDVDGGFGGWCVAFDFDEGGVFDALHHPQGEAVLLWRCWWQQCRRVRRRRWAAGSAKALRGSRGDLFVMFLFAVLREMCVNVRVFAVFALSEMIPGSGWQNSSSAAFVGRCAASRRAHKDGVVAEVWLSDGCRVLASVLLAARSLP